MFQKTGDAKSLGVVKPPQPTPKEEKVEDPKKDKEAKKE
jgi:hypothetical protein